MGNKKRMKRPKKKAPVSKVSEGIGSAYNEGFSKLVDTSSRDYIYDEIDQYHEDVEKADLKKAHKSMYAKKAKKENVLSLDMGSSDEENRDVEMSDEESDNSDDEEEQPKPFTATDDIVDTSERKLPDARAWGKDHSLYYGTNVTDQNLKKRAHQMHKKEVYDVATLEMEAHTERRSRLEQQLKNFDPTDILSLVPEKEASEATEVPSVIKTASVARLSKEERLTLLNKLSPEFSYLKDDMLAKMEECEKLTPLMQARADGLLGHCPGLDYAELKYRLCANYPLSVMCYVYVMLELGHDAVKTHPVMERLTRYRFLFKELEPLDKMMKDQVDALLDRLSKKLPLNLVHPAAEKQTATPVPLLGAVKSASHADARLQQQASQPEEDSSDSDDEESNAALATAAPEVLAGDVRREIGEAITKNRGLTPYRRKDLKNPRVKYKTKYKEKVKRRKGQVRPVRTEIPYYSGEKTGINPYAVKSIKLK